jgi:D-alanyl-D-alanine carboxypeptidase/D-alanyl-D-alanine-endopeptidase (penicillin-binding protein 4)
MHALARAALATILVAVPAWSAPSSLKSTTSPDSGDAPSATVTASATESARAGVDTPAEATADGKKAKKTKGGKTASRSVAARKDKEPPPKPPRVLRAVVVDGQLPEPLQAKVKEALTVEALDGVDVGFIAVDLASGQVLAETGADTLINPASNAKLITSAAALFTLKPEYRFKTEYYAQGAIKDGTLFGNLVVKGFGDPSVTSERLTKVANELFLMGIEKITGGIVIDDSWFDGVEEARGWELEEAPDRAYAAPVAATSVNYNAVAIYVRPGSTPGAPAVVVVDPPTERVVVKGTVTTEAVGAGVRVYSQKNDEDTKAGQPHDGTLITVEGSVGLRDPPARIYRRVYDPSRHFGSVLTSFLQQRGVKMRHAVQVGSVPAGARLILVDKSQPLKEIVDDLNHFSNNILAETLIKQMGAETMGAPGTFENGLTVSRRYLEDVVGFAPGSYIFENGSGLNDVNRFSARQLAMLTRAVAHDYEIATEWFTSLAVAGTQGTIGFRMKDTPAKRRLRAKTGTLRGVSALSGTVVRPSGEVVAFSILTAGYKSGASAMWKVQNALGSAFASDGIYDPEAKDEIDDGDAVSSNTPPDFVVEIAAGG